MTPDGRYEFGIDDLCALHLRINAWQASIKAPPAAEALVAKIRVGRRGPDKRVRKPRGPNKNPRRRLSGRPWGRPPKTAVIATFDQLPGSLTVIPARIA